MSERGELVDLLRSLSAPEWLRPTPAPRWLVRDVAVHLLDDDLGWLSRGRDGELAGLLPMDGPYRDFVAALDEKNQRWVEAAQGLSQRLVTELLEWAGEEVLSYYDSLGADGTSGVVWAGGQVARWLGIGRDFTERWVHHQQIRAAVGRPEEHARHLPLVLEVFVRAFPHQVRTVGAEGTTVGVDLGAGRWHLVSSGHGWELEDGPPRRPRAVIAMDADTAWRQLTGASVASGAVHTEGDPDLVRSLLAVRSIIV